MFEAMQGPAMVHHHLALTEACFKHGCTGAERWWRSLGPVSEPRDDVATASAGSLQAEWQLLHDIEAYRPWPSD